MPETIAQAAQRKALEQIGRARRAQERAHQHDGIRRDYVLHQARGAEVAAQTLLNMARIAG